MARRSWAAQLECTPRPSRGPLRHLPARQTDPKVQKLCTVHNGRLVLPTGTRPSHANTGPHPLDPSETRDWLRLCVQDIEDTRGEPMGFPHFLSRCEQQLSRG